MALFVQDGSGGNGQRLVYRVAEQEEAAAGGNKTITGMFPADAWPLFVRCEVVPLLGNRYDQASQGLSGGGVTGYAVGTAADPNLWGDVAAVTVGTRNDWGDMTAAMPRPAASALDVTITWAGGSPTAGRIRTSAHYLFITRD